jgi:hypothetical protein
VRSVFGCLTGIYNDKKLSVSLCVFFFFTLRLGLIEECQIKSTSAHKTGLSWKITCRFDLSLFPS